MKSKGHSGKFWIHIYCAKDITLKFLHKSRGKEAINHIGIVPKYTGIIIHDCWSSYFSYKNNTDALCGSHILRELVFIEQSNNYRWAVDMQKLLNKTCHQASNSGNKRLDTFEFKRMQKIYISIIVRRSKRNA